MNARSPERGLIRQAVAGTAIAAVLAVAAVLVILQQRGNLAAVREALYQSFSARALTLDVFSLVQQAESAQRGYILSGERAFLEPYDRASQDLPPALRRLRDVFSDSPSSSALAEELAALVNQKMAEMAAVVDLHETAGGQAAAAAVRQGPGKRIMDRIRQQVDQLLAEEEGQTRLQLAAERRHGTRALAVALALIAAVVATVALTSGFVLFSLRQRLRAEAALRSERHRAQGLQRIAEATGFARDFPMALVNTLATLGELVGAHRGEAVWRPPSYSAMHERRFAWACEGAAGKGFPIADVWHDDSGIVLVEQGRPRKRGPWELRIPVADSHLRVASLVLVGAGRCTDRDTVMLLAGSAALQLTHAAERQRILDSLADALARARGIFRSAIDGILTISESGTIESINPAAARMFGYAPAEAERQPVSLVLPEGFDALQGTQHGVAGRDGLGRVRESVGRHRVRGSFPVDVAASELHLFGRRMVVAIVRDASERKRNEKIKNDFVATVSHELRTPLTSISGALGLLVAGAAGSLPAPALRLLTIAHNNTERLTRLVGDILDIEKMESGVMRFDVRPVLLDELVPATLEANHGYAEQHGVHLRLQARQADCCVMADADRLTQVLTNLFANAIKFSPAGAAVDVSVDRADGMGVITVADRGPGIPAAFQDRVFEKFAQADTSDHRRQGGTGLGLSIAKEIIDRLNGRIGYRTSEAGTTFTVELPLAPADIEQAGSENDAVARAVC